MKIYINDNYEIKEINNSNNKALTMYEVDRKTVFGDKSDFLILNYCYKPIGNGYSIYPAKNSAMLELLDSTEKKISILEAENETLKQELSITQDAVNELIFNSLNM